MVIMRLIFVDDSQQRDPPRAGLGPLIALGGVLIPDTAVRAYSEGFADLRQSLNIPVGEEIKWNPTAEAIYTSRPTAIS